MKLYQIIFSPTGRTRKVCDAIAAGFNCPRQYISILPQRAQETLLTFLPDDVIILGAPSFGGRVPAPFAERMKTMKGNGARAVLVTSYGNRDYEDTLLEMKDLAEAAGFRIAAAAAALAEHSITHAWAKGRPDEEDRKELCGFGKAVFEQLTEGTACACPDIPGQHPYKEFGGIAVKPSADDRCIRCGICASQCPTGAIPAADPKQTNEDLCITCMACVSVCPCDARSIPEAAVKGTIERLDSRCQGRKANTFFFS